MDKPSRIAMALEEDKRLPADLHEMDWMVDMFAEAMKVKLIRKAREGFSGGLLPAAREEVFHRLLEHIAKAGEQLAEGQEIDIASLAMMLWGSRWIEHAKAASGVKHEH